jgi:oligoribonuclease NrnB/cAMP/cGMP phosphodiesterase (DHH superfamily)
MERKYILAHGTDVDGIACHTIADMNGFEKHIFSDYPQLHADLEYLADCDTGEVIIADLNSSGEFQPFEEVISRLSKQHELLAWVDHHDWSGRESLLAPFTQSVIDPDVCSSALVRQYFCDTNPTALYLAKLGQAHDFRIQGSELEAANNLQKAISFANNSTDEHLYLEHMVMLLANGQFQSQELAHMAREYDSQTEQAKKELSSSIQYRDLGLSTVAFGFAPQILYMKPGLHHLKETTDADIYCVAFPDGPVLVDGSTTGTKYDIVTLCKSNGGGGRNNSGGFILDKEDVADQEGFIDYILTELSTNQISPSQ